MNPRTATHILLPAASLLAIAIAWVAAGPAVAAGVGERRRRRQFHPL
jgi:hypothetical protein